MTSKSNRPVRTAVAGLVALAAAATTVTVLAAPASAAGACPAPIVSNVPTQINDMYGDHLGVLYIGYIGGTCRKEYAEVRWTNSDYHANSGSIWLEDAYGHQAGKVYFGGKDLTGFNGSQFIPIDGYTGDFNGYYYSTPHIAINWVTTVIMGPVSGHMFPTCIGEHDYHGNYHDFYNGYNSSDHSSEKC
ncbi:hypothetical protein AB0K51_14655 [Kitasatospora sp. NPDC049285]|uniref:hypothetical protein n=1 Tax=Kitasatospora sp. NPDC049285 TaxID=3157096 RepID=UPI00341EBBEF